MLPAAQARRARPLALLILATTVALACIAAAWFDWSSAASMQLTMRGAGVGWRLLGSSWNVGVDGLSMPLVVLTAVFGFISCWASYGVQRSLRAYCALMLWTTAALIGAFVTLDLLMFFVFFQLALVPLYFLVGIWGGLRKEYAASKFFLFSMMAAAALLIACILIYSRTHGVKGLEDAPFYLTRIAETAAAKTSLAGLTGQAAFWLILIACGILMGAAPFHTWLGDLLCEAPTPVAFLALTVVTKVGMYGLMRIAWPLFPSFVAEYAMPLRWLAAAAIVYAALVALAQKDLRRMLAMASVAQMGFFVLGLAAQSPTAALGSAFVMMTHAVMFGMLLMVSGIIADRTGHAEIRRLGGLGKPLPALAGWEARWRFWRGWGCRGCAGLWRSF